MTTSTLFDFNSHLVPMAVFAFSMAGSPGPNNVMLTASGTNFGFVRTIPHIIGILAGTLVMLFTIGAGLGVVFDLYPFLHDILRIGGTAVLLYIAWRIATASGTEDDEDAKRPMNSLEALLFQFINPKMWLMVISAISTFSLSGPNYWTSVMVICGVFMLVMSHTLSLWASGGALIRRKLSSPSALLYFNRIMGALTAASVAMIWN